MSPATCPVWCVRARPRPASTDAGRRRSGRATTLPLGELFGVVTRTSLVVLIGLSLLERVWHRRLVEFEPLAGVARTSRYEVVLRIHAGDQRTVLVDERFFSVDLVGGTYRHGTG